MHTLYRAKKQLPEGPRLFDLERCSCAYYRIGTVRTFSKGFFNGFLIYESIWVSRRLPASKDLYKWLL